MGEKEKILEEAEKLISENRERSREVVEGINRQFYKAVSNWIQGPIFSHMNKMKVDIDEVPIKKEYLDYIISLVEFTNLISFSSAVNKVFPKMIEDPEKHPWDIISENNWFEDQSENEVEEAVEKILNQNPKEFERLKNGEQKLFGFFIGLIKKHFEGKADGNLIKEILTKKTL